MTTKAKLGLISGISVLLIVGAIALFISLRRPDPVKSFDQFARQVEAGLAQEIEAYYRQVDADSSTSDGRGIIGKRSIVVKKVQAGDVKTSQSLRDPIIGKLTFYHKSEVPINGL